MLSLRVLTCLPRDGVPYTSSSRGTMKEAEIPNRGSDNVSRGSPFSPQPEKPRLAPSLPDKCDFMYPTVHRASSNVRQRFDSLFPPTEAEQHDNVVIRDARFHRARRKLRRAAARQSDDLFRVRVRRPARGRRQEITKGSRIAL